MKVNIIEYSGGHFPGYVTCSFVDAFGTTWHIDEKVPIVSSENVNQRTKFPITGYVAGEIISQNKNIVCFCTEKPWDIESRDGKNKFYINENQIIDIDK